MKKRAIFATLLIISILLAGCTVQPVPTEPATEPAATAPSEYTVTASGVTVKTDYGAYTAQRQSVAPKFTRLTDEPMPDLLPRDDYGTLYSFVGAVKHSDFIESCGYAFADAQGRVVTDAVYDSVSQLWNTDRTQGVWYYQKPVVSEYIDDSGEVYPINGECCGFATLDGSFATDCRYERIRTTDSFLMCIYPEDTQQHSPTRFDVYDYAGKLLLTSTELPFADRLSEASWSFDCVRDYLVVALRSDGEEVFESTRQPNYLATLDGELRFGPYRYIWDGADGSTVYVTTMDDATALLKPDGSLQFDRTFYSISADAPDRFVVMENEHDDRHVLDAEGNEVFSVPNADYLFCMDGYYMTNYEAGGGTKLLDRNGTPLPLAEGKNWSSLTGTSLCYYTTDYAAQYTVVNIVGGETLTLDLGTDGYISSCVYQDGLAFPYFVASAAPKRHTITEHTVYDEQLRSVLQFRGEFYSVCDQSDNTPYLAVATDAEMTLYNSEMQPIRTIPSNGRIDSAVLYGGSLSCHDDRSAYVYDADGSLVLCYPLYTLLDD